MPEKSNGTSTTGQKAAAVIPIPGVIGAVKDLRTLLEEPFDKSLIKTRPGNFGQTLAYIEGHEIIRRLNAVFDASWSFEVLAHQVMDTEVLVLGKLTCREHQIVKMAFGGSALTTHKETGKPISIVDDLKAASTDSLKKCATLLGVALHLYSDDAPSAPVHHEIPAQKISDKPNGKPKSNGAPTSTDAGNEDKSRLTSRQLSAIMAIGKERGLSRDQIKSMCLERFNKTPEFVTKAEASSIISELQSS